MHARLRLIVVPLCLGIAFLAVAQKRSITEKDLFQFNWIGDPQISPDGSRVAFVKVSVNEKKDGYDTSLWSISIRGDEPPRRMTSGNHDSSPRWSPDGKWLAFLRAPEPPTGTPGAGAGAGARPPSPQLYLLPVTGGESWKVTDLPRGANSPVWSPDTKMIAFISTTSPEDLARQKKEQKSKAADKDAKEDRKDDRPVAEKTSDDKETSKSAESEHESDVRVITRAVYRFNGAGYADTKHPQHIWVITAPQSSEQTVQPKQLTTGQFEEANPFWSKDGSQLFFTTTRALEPYYELPHTDIYSVAPTGGEPAKVLTVNMGIREISLSPDGKRLGFCGSVNEPVQSYTEPDLWVVDLAANAKPRNLTANYDFDMCSGVGGDQGTPRAGGSDQVIWSADGNSLITVTARQGKANLVQVDVASGKVSELTSGNQAVERYRATKDGSKFVVLISTPTNIGDLFVVDNSRTPPRQIPTLMKSSSPNSTSRLPRNFGTRVSTANALKPGCKSLRISIPQKNIR